ncbi:MAG TPA: phage/plasmid primase, P4 family [Bryobacteraceae bacterium]|jgi:putative DNA primase/helicase|nr:phage/plasmid primase, P4 family [Bryobacteraceae bacterium]
MAEPIAEFFRRLHGEEAFGHLIVWTRQDKATRAFDLAAAGALTAAMEYCRRRAETCDVYAAVGLQASPPAGNGRGTEDGVCSVPAVWADIDIAGPAHASKDLPATEQDAVALIEAVGLPPSIIVRSGFGLQVYWRYKEPWRLETAADRAAAKSLSTRFQGLLRQLAQSRGWGLDSTPDLCRVLRVPGTFNRKLPPDIRSVTAEYSDSAYTQADIEEILAGIEDPGPLLPRAEPQESLPPAKLPLILEGCPWMQHCRDDARNLPEPEWYRLITVVARCEDAERWAHELSKAYPRYSRRETAAKLRQASRDNVAPVTCAYVQSDLGGEKFCAECLFRGNVNSPIAIGRIETDGDSLESAAPESSVPHLPGDSQPASGDPPGDPPPEPESEISAAAAKIERFTDLGNAKRFAAKYRERLRYCEKWARWYAWDGMRWREDEVLEVYHLGTALIRSLYSLAKRIPDEEEREAFLAHLIKSESWRSITAMINLAKADPAIAIRPSDLDSDPWLLTVRNGTIDLHTGQLRPHNQRDLMTKLAPVTFDPKAACPNWLEFLYMVMNRRSSLVAFLQRAFGCCLTGITSDKAMFIMYGAGGDNGKSTMVDIIQRLMGDYATRTPVETFLKKKENAIPNDIAKLKGARFVWASENERGSRLSEALIKEMTGGDKMSARFMRGEYFEFYPEFKPWLATNHKPQVRGDRALWNRLKLIPFDVTIPKDQQKPRHEVTAMFQAEFPGILVWAVQGCLAWQREGLGVPDEVMEATREYEAEQDTFAMFLEEKCIQVPNARALSLALYREYKSWAEQYGEAPVSHKMFASFMSERGFAKTKTMKGAVYLGIGLRAEDRYDMPRQQGAPRQSEFRAEEEGEEV